MQKLETITQYPSTVDFILAWLFRKSRTVLRWESYISHQLSHVGNKLLHAELFVDESLDE